MRILFLILLATWAYVFPVNGQNAEFPNAIHAKLNLTDYGIPNDTSMRIGQGFEVAYFRNIAPWLNVGIPFKLGLAKLPNQSDNTVTAMVDVQAQIGYHKSTAKISPYLMAGAGIFAAQNEKISPNFPIGVGVHFRISKYAFVNLQGEYRMVMNDESPLNNVQLGAGYVYLLHRSESTPVAPPAPEDRDNDGVPDLLDMCPDEAGPAAALGCPDRDEDGIGDKEDKCPDLKGEVAMMGCPDTDNDGIADGDDLCPNEAGPVNGCPDSDGDGFADREDECPNEVGRWKGCPDADFDGVADKDDKCPNDPGKPEFQGCPNSPADADSDGFPDEKDECPSEKGTINGCPDADGDGIADKNDPCPTAKGEFGGCPDTDGDGVADNLDKCPTSPGTATNAGCPEIKQEVKERLTFAMRAVQFETGSAQLKMQSYAILDEIMGYLKDYPDYKLSIAGHTDNVGSEEKNMQLSTDRAKACYDYFVFRGISPARLKWTGFGPYRPIAENSSSVGRELNRRVEFSLNVE